MKKTSLFLSMVMAAICAQAEIVTPSIYSENFNQMGQENNYVVAPWTVYGIDAKPSMDDLYGFFVTPDGVDHVYGLLQYLTGTYAISNTNFVGNATADQWLVSPEIEVPYDAITLSFTTAFYNAKGNFSDDTTQQATCPFDIYVSESGVAKEDFNPVPVFSATASASREEEISFKSYVVALNGYKDKKIHLAFVQKGKGVGPFGFTNIYLGNYYVDFQNLTPNTLNKGDQIYVDANVGLKTSATCPGADVEISLNGTVVKTDYIEKKNIDNVNKGVVYIRLSYDDLGEIGDDAVSYKISVTPRMEGASPSYVTGTIAVPVTQYPNNVVMEEITASGCQFCPIGNAAMEYYADTYNLPGRGKFIGIAIHGNVDWHDPMSDGVEEYRIKSQTMMANYSLPAANFNRATIGQYPYNTGNVSRLYSMKSLRKVEIKGVSAPMSLGIEEAVGHNIIVDFDAYSAFNTSEPKLSAAVVLIENDVRGNTDGYTQNNAFYNKDGSTISGSYNAPELIPYMKKYLHGGEFGISKIPFDQIAYQHVARGIYPYFHGEPLTGEMVADQPMNHQITFQIPENVDVLANTEVIVLLLDEETNQIVASDIFPASSFTDNTGVKGVADETYDWTLAKDGKDLKVSAKAGSSVALYSADGTLLGNYTMESDYLTIATDSKGVVIVKVNGSARKVIL